MWWLCEQDDRATAGHSFQPHPPQPIRVVAHGRLAHPSHALVDTPRAVHEARATVLGG